MKRISIVVLSVLLAPPLFADAGEHLIPAGSLISCTTGEPRLSSKTTAVGDPVLCQLGHSERYGRSVLPYNSYLVGRFEEYRDPGHFVGKGWMELRFDRMVIEPDTIIPVDARVVDAPGYKVDAQGRILGKGHAVRDVVLWSIPILWPVDLLMLPMRGPRPVLKEETRLTLKVMDDLPVPDSTQPNTDQYGLRHRSPDAENAPPPEPYREQQYQEPQQRADYGPPQEQQPQYEPPPQPSYAYAQPAPYAYVPAPMMVVMPAPVIAYTPMVVMPQVVAQPMVVAPQVAAYAYAPPVVAARPYAYGYGGPGYGYGAAAAVRPRMEAWGGPAVARAGFDYRGSYPGSYGGSFGGR
ncbi:MAG TPA: hypothetical protein VKB38_17990 [Terracidiphilus sp.]|nr:hypothetical protein [Terracidiphilus sp.]